MLNNRQLQECIDEIRDGSQEAITKLVNEYYTFYENAALAANLSAKDAKHFANHATRSLFSNIRSISDAESWQALADQELVGLAQYAPEVPPAPAKPKKAIIFDEEEAPAEKPRRRREEVREERYEDAPEETIVVKAEKPKSAKDKLKHLFDDEEEEDVTEEIRPTRRPKKKPEPVYEEETEEIQRPVKKKRKFEDLFDDDDTEEIRKPKKQEKKKPKRVEEEDDYDDDYDDDEEGGFHLPVWLLALIAVVLLIGFGILAVKIFLPDTWESITGKFGKKEQTAEKATPTPEATPSEEPQYTVAPEESAEPGAETAEQTQEPEPEAPANSVIGTASVKVDKLNIRSKPSTSGDRVGTAVNGKSYDVYETATGEGYTWYRIADNQWIADKGGSWVTYTAN